MRLDRLLSNMGVGSRKEVKKLISSGVVTVDGVTQKNPETEISEDSDVRAAGRKITYKRFVYLMMNKPGGVISAVRDEHGDVVAADLVGEDYNFYGLSPAGRLDKDSEGLLILTNDGDFIHGIISPGRHVDKKYYIEAEGEFTEADCRSFEKGITLGDGYVCLPARLEIIESQDGKSRAYVTVHEGKFHQVKRMAAACGKKVTYLKRVSVGSVLLDEGLKPGAYRELTEEELRLLKRN